MDFKEKWKLMKRLDQSLIDQAVLLGACRPLKESTVCRVWQRRTAH